MILKLTGQLIDVKWSKIIFAWNQRPPTCLDKKPGKKPWNRKTFWVTIPRDRLAEMRENIGLDFVVHVEVLEYDFLPEESFGKKQRGSPQQQIGVAFKLVSMDRAAN